MTDLTQEQLQQIMELGKLEGCKAGWFPEDFDETHGEEYKEAGALFCNAAPILAQRLLAIGKLCGAVEDSIAEAEEARDRGHRCDVPEETIRVADVRKILEGK